MATQIKDGDLMFLADETSKLMKEVDIASLTDTVTDDMIAELDLQRITNTEIEEMLT